MAKILSFSVTDDFYERIVTQQKKANCTYLSPFLRALIDDALTVLENNPIITGGNEDKSNG